jgi:soluble P-type ATPase
VEAAHPKLHIEEVITRVVRWLFLIVGSLVALTLIVSFLQGGKLLEILPLSLVLLMSAVPVALPVMFTVSMALGSMELARHGVLVTRLSAAEDAATMDLVCADKTGTLTMNRLQLVKAVPQPGFTADDVVRDGAFASNEADQDAIDLAFLRAARDKGLPTAAVQTISFTPFSPSTRRTEAGMVIGGRKITVMKGALRSIAQATGLDETALITLEASADEEVRKGFRVLAVACSADDRPPALVGLAFLYDAPRPDSRALIEELRALGVGVKMLTGDALPVASEVAHELGVGEIVRATDLRDAKDGSREAELVENSNGFAEVFPEDKFLVVKTLQQVDHIIGMTGDGVNDAPALRQAEVGIAVDGATDVAKGAASAVLTTEGLAGIVDLVRNGRAIYQRVLTWIINKISRTILKAGFVVIAFLQVCHLGTRHGAARFHDRFRQDRPVDRSGAALAEAGDLEHRTSGRTCSAARTLVTRRGASRAVHRMARLSPSRSNGPTADLHVRGPAVLCPLLDRFHPGAPGLVGLDAEPHSQRRPAGGRSRRPSPDAVWLGRAYSTAHPRDGNDRAGRLHLKAAITPSRISLVIPGMFAKSDELAMTHLPSYYCVDWIPGRTTSLVEREA